MATLLFKNTNPPAPLTDPAYLAGIAAIANAIANGSKIWASLTYLENGVLDTFYVALVAVKVGLAPNSTGTAANYAYGIIPLRPPINDQAQVINENYYVSGGIDSLGNYTYGIIGDQI